jgi:signal transduction histidine kinase
MDSVTGSGAPMLRNSLRFRIISAFCLFCIITGITYTGFVLITLVSSEDAVFNHRVSLEINDFLNRYETDRNALLPSSAYINGYIGTKRLSDQQKRVIENKPDSVFEYQKLDLHVGIASLPDTHEKLYVFYNTETLEIHENRMKKVIPLMGVSIVFFLGLAIIFSVSVSNKVLQPVIWLADIIRASDPLTSRTGFSKNFYHDEIGFLAQTLERYIAVMDQAIEEEKRFASDVSHELRTPVTTVKGALDVMKRKTDISESKILRPIARIDRAVKDMENLIETFLTLSRIKGYLPEKENFQVFPVIQDIIDQNRYILHNKNVDVKINGPNDLTIFASAVFYKIVVSNLIRNAFQYTQKGAIAIDIQPNCIYVKDTGSGFSFPNHSQLKDGFSENTGGQGFGIGLSIVKRLCDKAGWHLEVSRQKEGGTRVCLKYE